MRTHSPAQAGMKSAIKPEAAALVPVEDSVAATAARLIVEGDVPAMALS